MYNLSKFSKEQQKIAICPCRLLQPNVAFVNFVRQYMVDQGHDFSRSRSQSN